MRNSDFIAQFQLRLVELGCPRKQMRRLVREIAEHREDLTRAALAEGLTGEAPEAWVTARLGNPVELAEHEVEVLRQSSWWSRHCFLGFCLLPVVAVPLIWAGILCAESWLAAKLLQYWYGESLHLLGKDMAAHPALFHQLATLFHAMDTLAALLTTALFWWQASRSGVGFRWLAIACGVTTVLMSLIWVNVSPHSVYAGYGWWGFKHHWFKSLTPLLVLGIAGVLRWRSLRQWQTKLAVRQAIEPA